MVLAVAGKLRLLAGCVVADVQPPLEGQVRHAEADAATQRPEGAARQVVPAEEANSQRFHPVVADELGQPIVLDGEELASDDLV